MEVVAVDEKRRLRLSQKVMADQRPGRIMRHLLRRQPVGFWAAFGDIFDDLKVNRKKKNESVGNFPESCGNHEKG